MKNLINLLIALLLVSTTLVACATPTEVTVETATEPATETPTPTTEAAADLEGILWSLDFYLNSGGESVDVLPDTGITLEFEEGKIGGSAGCNTYFASYEIDDSSLTLGAIGMTEMYCAPEVLMDQESAYLAVLKNAASYRVTEGKLQLANADGETLLSFSVLEPTPLTGTTWRLTGFNDGQGGFVSLLSGTEITALFDDEGGLSGTAGCNNYKASYEIDGGAISIGPAAATRMMCAKPDGVMDQESAYLATLESVAAYQIKGDSLGVFDADGTRLASYTAATEIGMANPASVYCEEQGGRLEIRTDDSGGQAGYCIFADGSECEEWAFFRRECAPASASSLSLEALKNATYPSELEESGDITLTDGRYEGEPFVEGGASRPVVILVEPVAFGDLDGDGIEDAAVILAANAGGSGTFISLEAVRNEGGEPVHLASYPLGDRAQIESLAVEGGQITLEMIAHGPDDPMCCPTQLVRNVYALEGDTLIEVSSEVVSKAEEPSEPTAQLTLEALQNASYQGIYDEPVQLTDGRYEGEPFVPGGASRPTVTFHPEVYAFGDLNDDGVDDAAVILIENSGGSGNFRYLAAVINEGGAPVNVATQFVGDREQVQVISIDGNEITVDMITHGPDDPMCCPTQLVRNVYALEGDTLIEVSSEVVSKAEEPSEPTAQLTLGALRNATYPSEWEDSGSITLTDGRYEGEPYVEGGASRLVVTLISPFAFGDLTADGVEDAVAILVANPGGSGTFYSLEALGNESGEPVHLASYPLGDRAQIRSLVIEGGGIELEMVTHGPDDSMCCPTQIVYNVYALEGGELVEKASEVIGKVEEASEMAVPPELVGKMWYWQSYLDTAGVADILVDDPEQYTVIFLPDGKYWIQADCNSGTGRYTVDGSSLTLEPGPITLVACGPESLDGQYLAKLGDVVSFVPEDGKLILNLKMDAGNMVFGSDATPAASLEGTLWKLDSHLNSEGDLVAVLPETEITADFEAGQVTGNAGCNSYFGAYESDGNSLTLGAIGVTEMYCAPEALMDQEGAYLAALESAASYQIVDGKLQVANADGETALTFSALEPAPLTGTTWWLNGYNDGQGGFVSVLSGTEITALFGDDGKVAGSAGCNDYTASYSLEGDAITFGPAATTRKMCAEPEGIMEQESAYLAALESVATYQISDDQLTITNASDQTVLTFTALP